MATTRVSIRRSSSRSSGATSARTANPAGGYAATAAKEVDSSIAAAKALSAAAAEGTRAKYAQYLNNLDAEKYDNVAALAAGAVNDNAAMANRLAARGLSGDGAVQFNTGRLNAEHADNMASMYRKFQGKRGDLYAQQAAALDEIDGQDRATQMARTGKIGELARLLEDRDKAEAYKQAQLDLQKQQMAWERSRYASDKAGQSKQDEAIFRENLRLMGEQTGWKTLAPLARWARQNNRDIRDYYNLIPQELLAAAAGRRNLAIGMAGEGHYGNFPLDNTGYMPPAQGTRLTRGATAVDRFLPNLNPITWADESLKYLNSNDSFKTPSKRYYNY